MRYYPIAIILKNKKAVVVGGGAVAERKILSLADAGADITVVSPEITGRLTRLVKDGRIRWLKHFVKQSDLSNADIIIAASSDASVNKRVSSWAKKIKTAANVVDNSALSDFISPAVFKKQKAIIAVYTDGREPELSRDLKNFLKEHWDEFISYRNRS